MYKETSLNARDTKKTRTVVRVESILVCSKRIQTGEAL